MENPPATPSIPPRFAPLISDLLLAGETVLAAATTDASGRYSATFTPGAKAFWQRLGFAEVGRLDRGVTVYEKRIG